jgi:hypothetical protein
MDMLQYYYTAKVVGIKSKRLGYLYYSVVSLIIVYTLYAMLINKQYFAFEGQLFGAVGMRLNYDQPQISTNGLNYCSDSAKGRCEILDKYDNMIKRRIYFF